MSKLNRRRPFGRITPPYHRGDFDRAAFYEQDGQFFDQHDRLIVPGVPAVTRPVVPYELARGPVTKDTEPDVPPTPATPPAVTVIVEGGGTEEGAASASGGGSDPLDHDRDGEKGGSVPASPDADQLSAMDLLENPKIPWATFRKAAMRILGDNCPASKQAIIKELEAAVKGFEEHQARRRTTAAQAKAQADKPADPADNSGSIDLAAWGRGQRNYLWTEVQREIRTKYSKQVTERRDAVDFLIEEGLITAESARKDVR